jgi:hypothetical protein
MTIWIKRKKTRVFAVDIFSLILNCSCFIKIKLLILGNIFITKHFKKLRNEYMNFLKAGEWSTFFIPGSVFQHFFQREKSSVTI